MHTHKQHIHLIGASGSGKTTLAKALAERLGYAHFDADDYFHEPTDPPFQRQRPPEECRRLMTADLKGLDNWVISGSVLNWGEHPLLMPSLLVLIQLPQDIRLQRLRQRERERFGSRLDPGGDMHEDHLWFMNWTKGYEDGTAELNSITIHEAMLARQSCPTLRLIGPLSLTEQIDKILDLLDGDKSSKH